MAAKGDLEVVEEVVGDFLRAAAPDLAVRTVTNMLTALMDHFGPEFTSEGALLALNRLVETSNYSIGEIEKKKKEQNS